MVSSECFDEPGPCLICLNSCLCSTVAVALWAMTPNVTITPDLRLVISGVYEGGVGDVKADNPVWSPVGRE